MKRSEEVEGKCVGCRREYEGDRGHNPPPPPSPPL